MDARRFEEYLLQAWKLVRALDARLVCLAVVVLGVLYVEPTLTYHAHPVMYDDWVYWRISNDLGDPEAPFNARILVPVIVHILPLNHIHSFFIITAASLMLMLWVFYLYLKELKFTHWESIIGIVLLGATPMFLYTERIYSTPEATFFLMFVTSFYAIAAKKDWLFIVALAVGLLTKETMLFVIPMYLFMIWRSGDLFHKRRYVIVSILLGVVYLGFKMTLPGSGYISWGYVKAVWNYDMGYNNLGYMTLPVATYLSMGLLWLPALASVHRVENPFIRRSFIIAPLILSQLFLAVDVTRMMFVFFPIVVPLALTAFRDKKFLPALMFWSVLVLIITQYRFKERLWYWFEVNFTIAFDKVFIGIVAILLFWSIYSRWYAANVEKHKTAAQLKDAKVTTETHDKKPTVGAGQPNP